MTRTGATYARRSSEKQDDVSLKTQTVKNLEYATRIGITVPDEYVFEEDNFTGKVADRPALNQLLKLASEGKIQCIVVYLVDRWARDVGAGAELINRIFKLGIELHFVSWGTLVRDTPMDYARYNMEILFSDVERRTIVNRLHDGKVNKSKLGYITGAGRNVRYGYKRVERVTEHGRVKDLDRNFDQVYADDKLASSADVVTWLFRHIASRGGVTAACDLLNSTYHIPRPSGGTWDSSEVYKIVRATEYYGQFYYGKTDGRKPKPVEERVIIQRPDLALVDYDLWSQANAVIDEGKGSKPKYEFLFSRRVRCMYGHWMKCQPSVSNAKNPTLKKMNYYYACRRRRLLHHDCTLPYFNARTVDRVVFEWVQELLADPQAKIVGLQKAQKVALVEHADLIDLIAACDTTLAREERELDHLYNDRKQYRDEPRMLQRVERDIQETLERIERVKSNRQGYALRLSQQAMSDEEVSYRIAEIEGIDATLRKVGTLTFVHRRRLIELLDIRIVLGVEEDRKYIDILWYSDRERRWLDETPSNQRLDLRTPG